MSDLLLFVFGTMFGVIVSIIIYKKQVIRLKRQLSESDLHYQQEKEERIKAESQLSAFLFQQSEADKKVDNAIAALSSKALQNNNESFIKLAEQVLDKYISKANHNLHSQKESMQQIVEPLKKVLDKHEHMVRNFEQKNIETFGSLKNYLTELGKSQKSLEKETSALVTALKSPKVRGRWGEIGLRRIVEFSGMSPYCDFNEQVNVDTDSGKLRPDMIISLPENKQIVIDSKVPLSAYLESLETDDQDVRKHLSENHYKAVSQHVRDLSAKSYWEQFDNSVEFVVLYMEVESALGAALIQNQGLIEEGIKRRIVFATPTTLIALLQTVAYSWKQHKATENAMQIWQNSKDLYNRLYVFYEHIQKLGGQINTMVKTFNQVVGSWDSRVIPGIRKLNDLGAGTENRTIQNIDTVDLQARETKNLDTDN